jgi:hypothetical protein
VIDSLNVTARHGQDPDIAMLEAELQESQKQAKEQLLQLVVG